MRGMNMEGMHGGRGCGCCDEGRGMRMGMGGGMMHGEGMDYMHSFREPLSNKVMRERLELYKEELAEEIKYIESRIKELNIDEGKSSKEESE